MGFAYLAVVVLVAFGSHSYCLCNRESKQFVVGKTGCKGAMMCQAIPKAKHMAGCRGAGPCKPSSFCLVFQHSVKVYMVLDVQRHLGCWLHLYKLGFVLFLVWAVRDIG